MKTAESSQLLNDASNYDESAYKKPSVTVDIAICTVNEEKVWVLLLKRENPPFKGHYAIPGGFVDVESSENLKQTAERELREETGIEDVYLEQLKTYGHPDRDPRMRIITVAYFALVPYGKLKGKTFQGEDYEGDTAWFPLDKLPGKMAFDHRKILQDLRERLRGKVSYTPIAFSLLPKEFTWSELQSVYEILLSRNLISPPFRRKIHSMYKIKRLNRKKKNTTGRPSELLVYDGMKSF